MKIEAEVGVRIPEVRERQDLPEAGNGTENPPLESLEGLWSCQHLDFGLLASRKVKK